MPRRTYLLTVRCASGDGCGENATFSYPTKAEYADGYKRNHGRWMCTRHDAAEQVLGPGNEARVTVLTAVRVPFKGPCYDQATGTWTEGGWLDGLFWHGEGKAAAGSGFTFGPGFKAFASDFPEGTRLEVTARILPAGEEAGDD